MSEPGDIAVRVEGLAKVYRTGQTDLTVFENLNFTVGRGESVALMGPSGAGKSTLLHLLGGLDRPTRGAVYFGSKNITSLNGAELGEFRNREVGFVWQTYSLLPEFTALENAMMPLLIRGRPHREAAAAAEARLEEVGLSARRFHRAGELSGGEQQRVVLARALAANPSVLLADEPTGNLDFRTGEVIMDLFRELEGAHGLTSLIVTHNPDLARRCDRILLLEKGALRPFNGAPEAALRDASSHGSTYV